MRGTRTAKGYLLNLSRVLQRTSVRAQAHSGPKYVARSHMEGITLRYTAKTAVLQEGKDVTDDARGG